MNGIQKEQREKALSRSCGRCFVCGKPLSMGQGQYAHRIGLGCNSTVDVGKSKGAILDTLADILIKEMEDFKGEK